MKPRTRRLDARAADALIAGRTEDGELSALLSQMRALADSPAPAPSSALAALLEEGFVPTGAPADPVRQAVSWSRSTTWSRQAWALQVSLGVAVLVALVLGAAAGGALPAPAQTAVADVVEAVTPLHVPRPAPHKSTPPVDVPASAKPHPTPSAENSQRDKDPGKSDDPRPRPSSTTATENRGHGQDEHPTPTKSRAEDHRGPGGEDKGSGH